jgi:NarL family two-component system response regulator LiaR
MEQAAPIRVMLVDDHAVVRSGLAAFLLAYDDLEFVAEAGDGAEAVRLCERMQPDVILMDLLMPRLDGASATRAIRELYPHIQELILTSFNENQLVQEALQAGAVGYLLKTVTADELATAIRATYHRRATLAPEAAQVLIATTCLQDTVALGHDLTARERDVLALMAKGVTNAVIAETLLISRSTAKFHISNILAKLQATSRTEAVALALQANLMQGDSRGWSINFPVHGSSISG